LALPWKTIESVPTDDGPLELRARGERDFLITIQGRVLMNSHANRSELALARLACAALSEREAPTLLIGGLGMGCTLRAALDALPSPARVQIYDINAVVERWCRGPLSMLNGAALEDPRVTFELGDVAAAIATHADDRRRARLDGIVLDLYEGPNSGSHPKRDPFYGSQALDCTRRALRPGGVFGVWSEAPDEAFEKRLHKVGFAVERQRPGKGGLRHVVYLATRKR
jgi:spermidine synthase